MNVPQRRRVQTVDDLEAFASRCIDDRIRELETDLLVDGADVDEIADIVDTQRAVCRARLLEWLRSPRVSDAFASARRPIR